MRSFLISSSLLVIIVRCGYPIVDSYQTPPSSYETAPTYPVPEIYPTTPSYPTPSYAAPRKYAVSPTNYPIKPSYSAPPPPPSPSGYSPNAFSDPVGVSDTNYSPTFSGSDTFRQRAKARTVENHKFQRRALQPIRLFQHRKH